MNVSLFLYLERLAAPDSIEYLSTASSNKKPSRRRRGGSISSAFGKLPVRRNINQWPNSPLSAVQKAALPVVTEHGFS
jgi:hypothetical protein